MINQKGPCEFMCIKTLRPKVQGVEVPTVSVGTFNTKAIKILPVGYVICHRDLCEVNKLSKQTIFLVDRSLYNSEDASSQFY